MRHLNAPQFRKLRDLRDGVSVLQIEKLDDDAVMPWVSHRMAEMTEMISPLTKIIARFNKAWGALGEPGDVDEIHHTTLLLRDSLAHIVEHERRLRSVRVEPLFEGLIRMMQDTLGSQADKLMSVPERLDAIVELAYQRESEKTSEPLVINETIEFTVPDGWSEAFNREIELIARAFGH